MQNLYKTILLFFAFFGAINIINAQSGITLMRAEMRSFITEDGKVLLRWAPADFATWEWGINHGYILKRTTIKSGGVPVDVGEAMLSVLLDPEIKPWDESEFKELVNSDTSDWALIGAGSIYGEGFTVLDLNTADIMNVVSLNKEQQNRYSFGLFAAEQSFTVATAMGLAFIDLNAEPDKEYLYFLEMKDAAPGTAKETYLKVNMNAASVLPSPRLSIVAGDKSVTLRWERDDLEQYYNSYIVERSDDKGETYIIVATYVKYPLLSMLNGRTTKGRLISV